MERRGGGGALLGLDASHSAPPRRDERVTRRAGSRPPIAPGRRWTARRWRGRGGGGDEEGKTVMEEEEQEEAQWGRKRDIRRRKARRSNA